MFDSRRANKRVSIYEAVITADGYGGNLSTNTLVATRWCNLEDVNGNSAQNEAGLRDFNNIYKFTFRYDKNLVLDAKCHSLQYAGNDYSIISIKNNGFRQVSQTVTARQIMT